MNIQKLIRDKIPEIITANGQVAEVRKLNDDDYLKYLLKKVIEEATELIEAKNRR